MIIVEFKADGDTVLDQVDRQIIQMSETGDEAKYIVVGASAYEAVCRAISVRNRRGKGTFETYNYLPIVVDPFRTDTVCVLPAPSVCAQGVATYRIGQEGQ